MTELQHLFDELVKKLADRVAARLAAGALPGFVDQASSPLGRRLHIAAVRRRAAEGAPGAAVVGRRYLLSRDALTAELEALSSKKRAPAATPAAEPDPLASLREDYGLEKLSPAEAADRAIERARRAGRLRPI